jgi:hypothetical protein
MESKVPKLEVEGVRTFDVPEGKRLVLAIVEGGTGSRFGMYEIKVVVCTGPPVF